MKTIAEFSWLADDDAPLLTTSQIYQIERAASSYFGELLNDWLDEEELNDPLTTKVAITDQKVGLTETGERLKFELPSMVDFTYIGEKEIPSITETLQNLTDANRDSPAYSNLHMLAGSSPTASFTIVFSNTTTDASTLLYTVEDTSESGSDQTGLIVACTFASISLFLASLILLWAVGTFDGWKACKSLRSRFYLPSPKAPNSPVPYGMAAKSTAEETEAGESNIGADPMPTLDEERGMEGQGIEMTPSRGIFREDDDDSELMSPADSEFTDVSNVSSIGPLGIASMRKVKRSAAEATSPPDSSPGVAMSPESILADIKALPIDVD